MNNRIKEIFIAISNHRIVYSETNASSFVSGLKGIENDIGTVKTIKKQLKEKGVYFYVNDLGTVYELYMYTNPHYNN